MTRSSVFSPWHSKWAAYSGGIVRNPLRKAKLCLGVVLLGAGVASLAISRDEQLGPLAATIIGVVGAATAFMGFVVLLWTLLPAVGYVRLMSGKGVIARWHVSLEEWERFRVFDALSAAQDPSLRNDLRVRQKNPA